MEYKMGELISFPSNGATCTGYLAKPVHANGAGIIVIQEWWGLVDHIKNVADRFAEAGFLALAPDLYHGEIASEPDEAKKLIMEMQMKKAGEDIAGAAKYLAARDDVKTSIGVIGFCMGGSLAIWSATITPDIVAAVGFYPGGSWERMAPDWSRYAGKAAEIHCAESDGTSTAPGIQEALTGIKSATGLAQAFDYSRTQHAFFNDDRPEVFNKDAAELAWQRTIAFFTEQLIKP
jgi:carboxymethylenebutenolidase